MSTTCPLEPKGNRNKQRFRIPHTAIRVAILALGFRTWLVMGLIHPITIAGSSMVPTLQGPSVVATCPDCQAEFHVGAEFAARTAHAACPRCEHARIPLASSRPHQIADRLWVDRTAFARSTPRRGEVTVLRQPDNGNQLCVKRIVGLPGETIQLTNGDVWVNGQVHTKSLAEQYAMRRLVHREEESPRRWQSLEPSAWQWHNDHWQCTANDTKHEHRLSYVHHKEQPITDDIPYNAGVSRRLNRVRDFMLTANLRVEGKGALTLESHDGRQTWRVTIRPAEGSIKLESDGKTLWSGSLSTEPRRDEVPLVFSNFDRQLLLALDGHVELRYPLGEETSPAGTARPFSLGVRGLAVSLGQLTLYRDVYYGSHAELQSMAETPIQLTKNEYFILGDNPPISIDSRFWGPVSGRLLLGRPLGVR